MPGKSGTKTKVYSYPLLCFHYSVFVPCHLLCLNISFALFFGAKPVVVDLAFSNDTVFGVSIENDAFSNVSVSNDSTLNSVFKCLCFQSFLVDTTTQKRRHSTPFSYENGVMETGPNACYKQAGTEP